MGAMLRKCWNSGRRLLRAWPSTACETLRGTSSCRHAYHLAGAVYLASCGAEGEGPCATRSRRLGLLQYSCWLPPLASRKEAQFLPPILGRTIIDPTVMD